MDFNMKHVGANYYIKLEFRNLYIYIIFYLFFLCSRKSI